MSFYKLNAAIERGTKPDTLGSKPCHTPSGNEDDRQVMSGVWEDCGGHNPAFGSWKSALLYYVINWIIEY